MAPALARAALGHPQCSWGSQEGCGGSYEVSSKDTGLVLLRGGWRPRPREETGVSRCREDRQGRLACHPAYPTPCWDDAEMPTRIRPPREKEREERLQNPWDGSTLTSQGIPSAGASILFRCQYHTGLIPAALL